MTAWHNQSLQSRIACVFRAAFDVSCRVLNIARWFVTTCLDLQCLSISVRAPRARGSGLGVAVASSHGRCQRRVGARSRARAARVGGHIDGVGAEHVQADVERQGAVVDRQGVGGPRGEVADLGPPPCIVFACCFIANSFATSFGRLVAPSPIRPRFVHRRCNFIILFVLAYCSQLFSFCLAVVHPYCVSVSFVRLDLAFHVACCARS